MSLRPKTIPEVPEGIVRVANAAFPKGNLYLKMRDELGTFYEDTDFADLFPKRGQSAFSPRRLALMIHEDLEEKGLSPDIHLVDAGYPENEWMLKSQKEGIRVVGQARPNHHWQAKEGKVLALKVFVMFDNDI